MDWQTPLAIVACLFAAFVLWKNRPVFTPGGRKRASDAKAAELRAESAGDGPARAKALTDAADAHAESGRRRAALDLYIKAVDADPSSTAALERAATSLGRSRRALERLAWHALAVGSKDDAHRALAVAALERLASLYERRPTLTVRARAFRALSATLAASPSSAKAG